MTTSMSATQKASMPQSSKSGAQRSDKTKSGKGAIYNSGITEALTMMKNI